MTVPADGFFVETDPGAGILQPGWQGSRQGTQGNSDPPVTAPPCPNLTAWQILETTYKIGKEVVDCAAGLTGIKAAAEGLLFL